jgi:hypothetical protein
VPLSDFTQQNSVIKDDLSNLTFKASSGVKKEAVI